MRVLRLIKGDARRDRNRNVRIRKELHGTPVLENIERNKLRWYCCFKRTNEEKKPKMFLEWRPPGKRPLNHSRQRWIEGVDNALEKRGTSIKKMEERKKYERRGEWRNFIRDSPAHRLKPNWRIGEKW